MSSTAADKARRVLSTPAQPDTDTVTLQNVDTLKNRIEVKNRLFDANEAELASAEKLLNLSAALRQAYTVMSASIADATFIANADKYPKLRTAVNDATRLFSAVTESTGDTALLAAATVDRMHKTVAMVEDTLRVLDTLVTKLDAMPLPTEARRHIKARQASGLAAAQLLDQPGLAKVVESLTYFHTFVQTPLVLRVVDRNGIKSGVERTYDSSGGKSWFLVVEAVDDAGQVMPLEVTSSETGKTSMAPYYGLRVSQTEYNRVKQDKLADGLVDDGKVGNKPANEVAFRYGIDVVTPNNMILEW